MRASTTYGRHRRVWTTPPTESWSSAARAALIRQQSVEGQPRIPLSAAERAEDLVGGPSPAALESAWRRALEEVGSERQEGEAEPSAAEPTKAASSAFVPQVLVERLTPRVAIERPFIPTESPLALVRAAARRRMPMLAAASVVSLALATLGSLALPPGKAEAFDPDDLYHESGEPPAAAAPNPSPVGRICDSCDSEFNRPAPPPPPPAPPPPPPATPPPPPATPPPPPATPPPLPASPPPAPPSEPATGAIGSGLGPEAPALEADPEDVVSDQQAGAAVPFDSPPPPAPVPEAPAQSPPTPPAPPEPATPELNEDQLAGPVGSSLHLSSGDASSDATTQDSSVDAAQGEHVLTFDPPRRAGDRPVPPHGFCDGCDPAFNRTVPPPPVAMGTPDHPAFCDSCDLQRHETDPRWLFAEAPRPPVARGVPEHPFFCDGCESSKYPERSPDDLEIRALEGGRDSRVWNSLPAKVRTYLAWGPGDNQRRLSLEEAQWALLQRDHPGAGSWIPLQPPEHGPNGTIYGVDYHYIPLRDEELPADVEDGKSPEEKKRTFQRIMASDPFVSYSAAQANFRWVKAGLESGNPFVLRLFSEEQLREAGYGVGPSPVAMGTPERPSFCDGCDFQRTAEQRSAPAMGDPKNLKLCDACDHEMRRGGPGGGLTDDQIQRLLYGSELAQARRDGRRVATGLSPLAERIAELTDGAPSATPANDFEQDVFDWAREHHRWVSPENRRCEPDGPCYRGPPTPDLTLAEFLPLARLKCTGDLNTPITWTTTRTCVEAVIYGDLSGPSSVAPRQQYFGLAAESVYPSNIVFDVQPKDTLEDWARAVAKVWYGVARPSQDQIEQVAGEIISVNEVLFPGNDPVWIDAPLPADRPLEVPPTPAQRTAARQAALDSEALDNRRALRHRDAFMREPEPVAPAEGKQPAFYKRGPDGLGYEGATQEEYDKAVAELGKHAADELFISRQDLQRRVPFSSADSKSQSEARDDWNEQYTCYDPSCVGPLEHPDVSADARIFVPATSAQLDWYVRHYGLDGAKQVFFVDGQIPADLEATAEERVLYDTRNWNRDLTENVLPLVWRIPAAIGQELLTRTVADPYERVKKVVSGAGEAKDVVGAVPLVGGLFLGPPTERGDKPWLQWYAERYPATGGMMQVGVDVWQRYGVPAWAGLSMQAGTAWDNQNWVDHGLRLMEANRTFVDPLTGERKVGDDLRLVRDWKERPASTFAADASLALIGPVKVVPIRATLGAGARALGRLGSVGETIVRTGQRVTRSKAARRVAWAIVTLSNVTDPVILAANGLLGARRVVGGRRARSHCTTCQTSITPRGGDGAQALSLLGSRPRVDLGEFDAPGLGRGSTRGGDGASTETPTGRLGPADPGLLAIADPPSRPGHLDREAWDSLPKVERAQLLEAVEAAGRPDPETASLSADSVAVHRVNTPFTGVEPALTSLRSRSQASRPGVDRPGQSSRPRSRSQTGQSQGGSSHPSGRRDASARVLAVDRRGQPRLRDGQPYLTELSNLSRAERRALARLEYETCQSCAARRTETVEELVRAEERAKWAQPPRGKRPRGADERMPGVPSTEPRQRSPERQKHRKQEKRLMRRQAAQVALHAAKLEAIRARARAEEARKLARNASPAEAAEIKALAEEAGQAAEKAADALREAKAEAREARKLSDSVLMSEGWWGRWMDTRIGRPIYDAILKTTTVVVFGVGLGVGHAVLDRMAPHSSGTAVVRVIEGTPPRGHDPGGTTAPGFSDRLAQARAESPTMPELPARRGERGGPGLLIRAWQRKGDVLWAIASPFARAWARWNAVADVRLGGRPVVYIPVEDGPGTLRELADDLARAIYEIKPGPLVVIQGGRGTGALIRAAVALGRSRGLTVSHRGHLGLERSRGKWQVVLQRPPHRPQSAPMTVGRNTPMMRWALDLHLEGASERLRAGDSITLDVDARSAPPHLVPPALSMAEVERAAGTHGFEVQAVTYSAHGTQVVRHVILRRLPTLTADLEQFDPAGAPGRLQDWTDQAILALASGDHAGAVRALRRLVMDATLVAYTLGHPGGVIARRATRIAGDALIAMGLVKERVHGPRAAAPDSERGPKRDINELLAQLLALSATLSAGGTSAAADGASLPESRVAPDPSDASTTTDPTEVTLAHERDPNWTSAVPPPTTESEDAASRTGMSDSSGTTRRHPHAGQPRDLNRSRRRRAPGIVVLILATIVGLAAADAPASDAPHREQQAQLVVRSEPQRRPRTGGGQRRPQQQSAPAPSDNPATQPRVIEEALHALETGQDVPAFGTDLPPGVLEYRWVQLRVLYATVVERKSYLAVHTELGVGRGTVRDWTLAFSAGGLEALPGTQDLWRFFSLEELDDLDRQLRLLGPPKDAEAERAIARLRAVQLLGERRLTAAEAAAEVARELGSGLVQAHDVGQSARAYLIARGIELPPGTRGSARPRLRPAHVRQLQSALASVKAGLEVEGIGPLATKSQRDAWIRGLRALVLLAETGSRRVAAGSAAVSVEAIGQWEARYLTGGLSALPFARPASRFGTPEQQDAIRMELQRVRSGSRSVFGDLGPVARAHRLRQLGALEAVLIYGMTYAEAAQEVSDETVSVEASDVGLWVRRFQQSGFANLPRSPDPAARITGAQVRSVKAQIAQLRKSDNRGPRAQAELQRFQRLLAMARGGLDAGTGPDISRARARGELIRFLRRPPATSTKQAKPPAKRAATSTKQAKPPAKRATTSTKQAKPPTKRASKATEAAQPSREPARAGSEPRGGRRGGRRPEARAAGPSAQPGGRASQRAAGSDAEVVRRLGAAQLDDAIRRVVLRKAPIPISVNAVVQYFRHSGVSPVQISRALNRLLAQEVLRLKKIGGRMFVQPGPAAKRHRGPGALTLIVAFLGGVSIAVELATAAGLQAPELAGQSPAAMAGIVSFGWLARRLPRGPPAPRNQSPRDRRGRPSDGSIHEQELSDIEERVLADWARALVKRALAAEAAGELLPGLGVRRIGALIPLFGLGNRVIVVVDRSVGRAELGEHSYLYGGLWERAVVADPSEGIPDALVVPRGKLDEIQSLDIGALLGQHAIDDHFTGSDEDHEPHRREIIALIHARQLELADAALAQAIGLEAEARRLLAALDPDQPDPAAVRATVLALRAASDAYRIAVGGRRGPGAFRGYRWLSRNAADPQVREAARRTPGRLEQSRRELHTLVVPGTELWRAAPDGLIGELADLLRRGEQWLQGLYSWRYGDHTPAERRALRAWMLARVGGREPSDAALRLAMQTFRALEEEQILPLRRDAAAMGRAELEERAAALMLGRLLAEQWALEAILVDRGDIAHGRLATQQADRSDAPAWGRLAELQRAHRWEAARLGVAREELEGGAELALTRMQTLLDGHLTVDDPTLPSTRRQIAELHLLSEDVLRSLARRGIEIHLSSEIGPEDVDPASGRRLPHPAGRYYPATKRIVVFADAPPITLLHVIAHSVGHATGGASTELLRDLYEQRSPWLHANATHEPRRAPRAAGELYADALVLALLNPLAAERLWGVKFVAAANANFQGPDSGAAAGDGGRAYGFSLIGLWAFTGGVFVTIATGAGMFGLVVTTLLSITVAAAETRWLGRLIGRGGDDRGNRTRAPPRWALALVALVFTTQFTFVAGPNADQHAPVPAAISVVTSSRAREHTRLPNKRTPTDGRERSDARSGEAVVEISDEDRVARLGRLGRERVSELVALGLVQSFSLRRHLVDRFLVDAGLASDWPRGPRASLVGALPGLAEAVPVVRDHGRSLGDDYRRWEFDAETALIRRDGYAAMAQRFRRRGNHTAAAAPELERDRAARELADLMARVARHLDLLAPPASQPSESGRLPTDLEEIVRRSREPRGHGPMTVARRSLDKHTRDKPDGILTAEWNLRADELLRAYLADPTMTPVPSYRQNGPRWETMTDFMTRAGVGFVLRDDGGFHMFRDREAPFDELTFKLSSVTVAALSLGTPVPIGELHRLVDRELFGGSRKANVFGRDTYTFARALRRLGFAITAEGGHLLPEHPLPSEGTRAGDTGTRVPSSTDGQPSALPVGVAGGRVDGEGFVALDGVGSLIADLLFADSNGRRGQRAQARRSGEAITVAREVEALYRTRYEDLVWYVRRLSPRAEAEDLAQEAFALLVRHYGGQWDDVTDPVGLLKTIARNQLINQSRRTADALEHQAGAAVDLVEATADRRADVSAEVAVRLELAAVQWAIHAEGVLTDRQRTALLLVANGHSVSEIGAELGLDEQATRRLVSRARQSVRTELERQAEAMRLLAAGKTAPEIARILGLRGEKLAEALLLRVIDAREAMGVLDAQTRARMSAAVGHRPARRSTLASALVGLGAMRELPTWLPVVGQVALVVAVVVGAVIWLASKRGSRAVAVVLALVLSLGATPVVDGHNQGTSGRGVERTHQGDHPGGLPPVSLQLRARANLRGRKVPDDPAARNNRLPKVPARRIAHVKTKTRRPPEAYFKSTWFLEQESDGGIGPEQAVGNELTAWRLAVALGPEIARLVAPTMLTTFKGDRGILSLRLPGEVGAWQEAIAEEKAWAAFFDALIGNGDRHGRNVVGPSLGLFDHAWAFPGPNELSLSRTVFVRWRWWMGREGLTEREREMLTRLLDSPDLLGVEELLPAANAQALRDRARWMLEHGSILPPQGVDPAALHDSAAVSRSLRSYYDLQPSMRPRQSELGRWDENGHEVELLWVPRTREVIAVRTTTFWEEPTVLGTVADPERARALLSKPAGPVTLAWVAEQIRLAADGEKGIKPSAAVLLIPVGLPSWAQLTLGAVLVVGIAVQEWPKLRLWLHRLRARSDVRRAVRKWRTAVEDVERAIAEQVALIGRKLASFEPTLGDEAKQLRRSQRHQLEALVRLVARRSRAFKEPAELQSEVEYRLGDDWDETDWSFTSQQGQDALWQITRVRSALRPNPEAGSQLDAFDPNASLDDLLALALVRARRTLEFLRAAQVAGGPLEVRDPYEALVHDEALSVIDGLWGSVIRAAESVGRAELEDWRISTRSSDGVMRVERLLVEALMGAVPTEADAILLVYAELAEARAYRSHPDVVLSKVQAFDETAQAVVAAADESAFKWVALRLQRALVSKRLKADFIADHLLAPGIIGHLSVALLLLYEEAASAPLHWEARFDFLYEHWHSGVSTTFDVMVQLFRVLAERQALIEAGGDAIAWHNEAYAVERHDRLIEAGRDEGDLGEIVELMLEISYLQARQSAIALAEAYPGARRAQGILRLLDDLPWDDLTPAAREIALAVKETLPGLQAVADQLGPALEGVVAALRQDRIAGMRALRELDDAALLTALSDHLRSQPRPSTATDEVSKPHLRRGGSSAPGSHGQLYSLGLPLGFASLAPLLAQHGLETVAATLLVGAALGWAWTFKPLIRALRRGRDPPALGIGHRFELLGVVWLAVWHDLPSVVMPDLTRPASWAHARRRVLEQRAAPLFSIRHLRVKGRRVFASRVRLHIVGVRRFDAPDATVLIDQLAAGLREAPHEYALLIEDGIESTAAAGSADVAFLLHLAARFGVPVVGAAPIKIDDPRVVHSVALDRRARFNDVVEIHALLVYSNLADDSMFFGRPPEEHDLVEQVRAAAARAGIDETVLRGRLDGLSRADRAGASVVDWGREVKYHLGRHSNRLSRERLRIALGDLPAVRTAIAYVRWHGLPVFRVFRRLGAAYFSVPPLLPAVVGIAATIGAAVMAIKQGAPTELAMAGVLWPRWWRRDQEPIDVEQVERGLRGLARHRIGLAKGIPGRDVHAFFKPVKDDEGLLYGHEPGQTARNERATWLLAAGLHPLLARTVASVVLVELDGRAGSLSGRLPGKVGAWWMAPRELKLLAAFLDALIGNQDRTRVNAVGWFGRLGLFDHEFAFPKAGDRSNPWSVFIEWRYRAGLSALRPIEREMLERLLASPDLFGVEPLLPPANAEALRERAQRMLDLDLILVPDWVIEGRGALVAPRESAMSSAQTILRVAEALERHGHRVAAHTRYRQASDAFRHVYDDRERWLRRVASGLLRTSRAVVVLATAGALVATLVTRDPGWATLATAGLPGWWRTVSDADLTGWPLARQPDREANWGFLYAAFGGIHAQQTALDAIGRDSSQQLFQLAGEGLPDSFHVSLGDALSSGPSPAAVVRRLWDNQWSARAPLDWLAGADELFLAGRRPPPVVPWTASAARSLRRLVASLGPDFPLLQPRTGDRWNVREVAAALMPVSFLTDHLIAVGDWLSVTDADRAREVLDWLGPRRGFPAGPVIILARGPAPAAYRRRLGSRGEPVEPVEVPPPGRYRKPSDESDRVWLELDVSHPGDEWILVTGRAAFQTDAHGQPVAPWLLLDTKRMRARWREPRYDLRATQREFEEAGRHLQFKHAFVDLPARRRREGPGRTGGGRPGDIHARAGRGPRAPPVPSSAGGAGDAGGPPPLLIGPGDPARLPAPEAGPQAGLQAQVVASVQPGLRGPVSIRGPPPGARQGRRSWEGRL